MLRVLGLTAEILGAPVLRGVDLEVPRGAAVALVGRNGAGKTSLLRAIMGFLRVTSGRVTLDGAPIDGLPPHRRPRLGIGYAPEDRRLFGAFTVEGNVRLPGETLGLSEAEIGRRLEAVYALLPELAELRHRPAGGLSGGQGKMAALARALIAGTRVVLLDEPFQGLAPALARRYAATLRALREARPDVALLVTESNPALLEGLADRTYGIERGEVAATA